MSSMGKRARVVNGDLFLGGAHFQIEVEVPCTPAPRTSSELRGVGRAVRGCQQSDYSDGRFALSIPQFFRSG